MLILINLPQIVGNGSVISLNTPYEKRLSLFTTPEELDDIAGQIAHSPSVELAASPTTGIKNRYTPNHSNRYRSRFRGGGNYNFLGANSASL